MKLTNKDIDSEVWQKIRVHLIDRKQRMMEQLAHDLPEGHTAKLRGRIEECKLLLRLEEPEEEKRTEF